jgi:hypothetical protein
METQSVWNRLPTKGTGSDEARTGSSRYPMQSLFIKQPLRCSVYYLLHRSEIDILLHELND